MSDNQTAQSFFLRHEFLIRRIHSLTGIVPLGLYMCVHLATNASLLNGAETFQRAVYLIHAPGALLPLIEWGAIFTPLLFHAIIGIWIARSGKDNSSNYQFTSNRRYKWQRWTGVVALVYLFLHILHLHGWFHVDFYYRAINQIGFGVFRPYNAASTLAAAMDNWIWPPLYLVGILCCVYHLANGLWTSGITWGLWITPEAQKRATKFCTAFGLVLAVVSMSAWWAAVAPGEKEIAEMKKIEDRMYSVNVEAGNVPDNPHKRSDDHHGSEEDAETQDKE